MSFQQDYFLPALLLALLPVIIHLINQNRHRTVKWAAMMFLLNAKKLTKGIARLRQILILSLRVLAVAALIFAASRPLATGWLALTAGGDTGTILILLDRSASMEQQNLETGITKRSSALTKISEFLNKTARGRRIVLIDSATLAPLELSRADDLVDLPAGSPTDTAADIPSLVQAALDYVSLNQVGRTDIWLASDLRATDWQPASGRWESLRAAFAELPGVHFFLLNYPEIESDNLSVMVTNLVRRSGPDGMELLLDLSISSQSVRTEPITVPVELTVNGARTVKEMTIQGGELVLHGYRVDLGKSETTGWGRIDLPADANARDNTFYFVFDESPPLTTVIVSDDDRIAGAIRAAASAPVESQRQYTTEVISTSRTTEIPWDRTALLFWQAPLPEKGSTMATLLEQFVASGKSLVLLPPMAGSLGVDNSFLGIRWKSEEQESQGGEGFEIGWWRTDSGLVRNTRNGNPLPLGATRILKFREFEGEFQPLLKLNDNRSILARHTNSLRGSIYLWGTLPEVSFSTLASDGVAFFVMVHRALQEGSRYLSAAQTRDCGDGSLPSDKTWTRVNSRESDVGIVDHELAAGAFESGGRWLALNRPSTEDDLRPMSEEALEELFAGLDYRIIRETVDNQSSLASEVWKAFLFTMALALIVEAFLCLPPRAETSPSRNPLTGTPSNASAL